MNDLNIKVDFNNVNQFQSEFYNQLKLAKGGLEQKEGATMKSAMTLYQGKDLPIFNNLFAKAKADLKFSKPEDLNKYAVNFINKYAFKFINNAIKLSFSEELTKLNEDKEKNASKIKAIKEDIKSQLVVGYDTMKKDNRNLLRVLRDCLPVAFYLIASDAPIQQGAVITYTDKDKLPADKKIGDVKEDTRIYYTDDGKLLVNKTHSETIKEKMKLTQLHNACSFEDLRRMSALWFGFSAGGDKTKTGVQNLISKLRQKINDSEDFGANGDDAKIGNTLNDIVALVIENIDTLDDNKEFNSLDEIVEHIGLLSGYGSYNACTDTHNIVRDKETSEIKSFGNNRKRMNETTNKLELHKVKLIGIVEYNYDKDMIIQSGKAKSILGLQPVYTKKVAEEK